VTGPAPIRGPAPVGVGCRARVGDELAGRALALVQAKCMYALEVQARERPAPYSEPAATRRALARRQPSALARRGADGPGSGPGVAARARVRDRPSRTASTLTRAVGEGTGPAPGGAMSLIKEDLPCPLNRSRAARKTSRRSGSNGAEMVVKR
jgi:hypothetical protein